MSMWKPPTTMVREKVRLHIVLWCDLVFIKTIPLYEVLGKKARRKQK